MPSWMRVAAAAAVHTFTALGGVFGLLALLAASNEQWPAAFAWLGAALVVDGADGPLARLCGVKEVLPRFSGDDLDHVVDYVTYVTVPAFMVARSSIAPEGLRLPLAAAMMLVSLFHFSDTKSKTGEGYFVGFPAIWNIVVLYCFVLGLPPGRAAGLIAFLAVLTFIPLRWLHPLRVKRLRPITIAVMSAWAIASAAALHQGFPGTAAQQTIFLMAAVYTIALGLSGGSANRR
jgi:phosphatidylcholine synthase